MRIILRLAVHINARSHACSDRAPFIACVRQQHAWAVDRSRCVRHCLFCFSKLVTRCMSKQRTYIYFQLLLLPPPSPRSVLHPRMHPHASCTPCTRSPCDRASLSRVAASIEETASGGGRECNQYACLVVLLLAPFPFVPVHSTLSPPIPSAPCPTMFIPFSVVMVASQLVPLAASLTCCMPPLFLLSYTHGDRSGTPVSCLTGQ